jgi:hypothetical protein
MARQITRDLKTLDQIPAEVTLVQRFRKTEISDDFELVEMLDRGVAVHHAGLSDEVRTSAAFRPDARLPPTAAARRYAASKSRADSMGRGPILATGGLQPILKLPLQNQKNSDFAGVTSESLWMCNSSSMLIPTNVVLSDSLIRWRPNSRLAFVAVEPGSPYIDKIAVTRYVAWRSSLLVDAA